MNSSAVVWESLYRRDEEVVTTEDLHELAERLDKDPENTVRHLRRASYILPLFKGYYYVRSPEERELGDPRYNPLELFGLAAEAKGIGNWYFGLHTALRLNGMTHEDRREETVISDELYRIGGVSVGNGRFVVRKWKTDLTGFGLVEEAHYRYSDPAKTALDLAYLDYWHERKGKPVAGTWREHVDRVDATALEGYADRYPEEVSRAVRDEAG